MEQQDKTLKSREEHHLVQRALAGEEIAWKQISVRYKKTMKGAISSHLKKFKNTYDGELVFDIYQEVLMKLHRKSLKSFYESERKSKNLAAFLYTVATNTAKDFTRSKLGQSSLEEINPKIESEGSSSSLIDLVANDDSTPFDSYLKEQERRLLLEEVLSLKSNKQVIIELYLRGEKNIDIAKSVKKTESYVNKCVFNFKNYMIKKYKMVG